MLSTRGAITTNVALVECAAGQNKSDRSVFLLSELEKVWVSVAVVARRLLLDGNAVQIVPFGTLWLEDYVLLRDRQQRPYTTRKLCFGINQNYANRYGVDTSRVPIEKRSAVGCHVRVSTADIVAVCGVPAQTVSAALKEFFMYLGEGLSRGRIFHLSLPGIATIGIKQQKAVLTMNEELRHDLYHIDSRKWATELKVEGRKVLEDLAAIPASGFVSAQSSRPSTSRVSRASWRSVPAAAAGPNEGVDAKRAVFISAAPSGRTFEEIAQQEEQRRQAAQAATHASRELRRRQEELNRRIEHYYRYGDDDTGDARHADPMANDTGFSYEGDDVLVTDNGRPRTSLRPSSVSGESVYHILDSGERRSSAPSHQYGRRVPHSRADPHHRAGEPDVEVIEMADEDGDVSAPEDEGAHEVERRPLERKDAELERVLREEEPFTRPISRRTYHENCAARDLIYSQPYEAPERKASAAGPSPAHHPSRNVEEERAAGSRGAATRPPTQQQVNTHGQHQEDVFRYGRKRFDGSDRDGDHVGKLLHYPS